MKVGIRKPSIKKSIKARTTGKIKRKIKKTVNPLYGKKGMGLATNPKKAVYNKVYNKTTVGVGDIIKPHSKKHTTSNYEKRGDFSYKIFIFLLRVLGILLIALGLPFFPVGGFILVILGVLCFILVKPQKRNK